MNQGADPSWNDLESWARWPSHDAPPDPPADPPPPEVEEPVEPRSRRLIAYAAFVVTVFVLAGGVGFWYVQTAPARAFEAATASFHAEFGPLAEQLDQDLDEMREGESMSATHPVVLAASADAEALQDAYAAYGERLRTIDFRGDASDDARRLTSALNAGQLLMRVATTSYDKDNMLQVLQARPEIDATIEDAERGLRETL